VDDNWLKVLSTISKEGQNCFKSHVCIGFLLRRFVWLSKICRDGLFQMLLGLGFFQVGIEILCFESILGFWERYSCGGDVGLKKWSLRDCFFFREGSFMS